MHKNFSKINTSSWYLKFCALTAALGWLPFFFVQPMMHGGTLASVTLAWAGLVMGAYCSLELRRLSATPWGKIPALIGCILYGIPIAIALYFGASILVRLIAA
jgi:hypothetical protein